MKKRLSILIVTMFVALGVTLAPTSASAATGPVNVWADYYYVSPTESASSSTRRDPTPDNEYAVSPCGPLECAQIVPVTKTQLLLFKTKMVVLKMVPGETLVTGQYRYANDNGRYEGSTTWDGSAIPVTIKRRYGNKWETLTLRTASAELHNPAFPVLSSETP